MAKRTTMESKKSVKKLSIDLDGPSVYSLLREYFKAKLMFPKKRIEVYISNSGKGFHIEIDKELSIWDNFLTRAHFNDCPMRLRYNLQKYYMNPDESWNDLLFHQKNKGKRELLDLEKLLKYYKKEINFILQHYGNEDSIKKIVKIAYNIAPKIFSNRKYYAFVCVFNGRLNKERIKKFANNLFEKQHIKFRFFINFGQDNKKNSFVATFSNLKEAKEYKESFEEKLGKYKLKNWIKTIKY